MGSSDFWACACNTTRGRCMSFVGLSQFSGTVSVPSVAALEARLVLAHGEQYEGEGGGFLHSFDWFSPHIIGSDASRKGSVSPGLDLDSHFHIRLRSDVRRTKYAAKARTIPPVTISARAVPVGSGDPNDPTRKKGSGDISPANMLRHPAMPATGRKWRRKISDPRRYPTVSATAIVAPHSQTGLAVRLVRGTPRIMKRQPRLKKLVGKERATAPCNTAPNGNISSWNRPSSGLPKFHLVMIGALLLTLILIFAFRPKT